MLGIGEQVSELTQVIFLNSLPSGFSRIQTRMVTLTILMFILDKYPMINTISKDWRHPLFFKMEGSSGVSNHRGCGCHFWFNHKEVSSQDQTDFEFWILLLQSPGFLTVHVTVWVCCLCVDLKFSKLNHRVNTGYRWIEHQPAFWEDPPVAHRVRFLSVQSWKYTHFLEFYISLESSITFISPWVVFWSFTYHYLCLKRVGSQHRGVPKEDWILTALCSMENLDEFSTLTP